MFLSDVHHRVFVGLFETCVSPGILPVVAELLLFRVPALRPTASYPSPNRSRTLRQRRIAGTDHASRGRHSPVKRDARHRHPWCDQGCAGGPYSLACAARAWMKKGSHASPKRERGNPYCSPNKTAAILESTNEIRTPVPNRTGTQLCSSGTLRERGAERKELPGFSARDRQSSAARWYSLIS